MTPQRFIARWQGCQLAERAFYQQHFNDLCALADHPTPAAQDTTSNTFCFEKGATKTSGGNGWADVWKHGFFAVEYKGPSGDLRKALEQVQRYALALENPPLLVVARADLIEIHTNFTNTVSDTHIIVLEEIGTLENLAKLRALFFEPERLRPVRTTRALTEQAANLFASLANTLCDRGHAPQQACPEYSRRVAHFLDKLLFCFFAEDAGLLPKEMVTRVLENGAKDPARIDRQLKQLFTSMSRGGDFGAEIIDWFNGGLFDSDATLPLQSDDITALITVARLDWAEVEPSIFGTLFERGLDPSKRSQLGAHYTDPQSIMRIVEPVIVAPLNAEWETAKAQIAQGMAGYAAGGKGSKKGIESAQAAYQGFMQRLTDFRVLDPACGSGNFLYLALHALKDIEHRAALEAEVLGLPLGFAGFHTGPHNVMGIELNSYAAELARVTVWIGELQWMLRHGMSPSKNPILKPLNHIVCRDAVLNEDGSEAQWPDADCIVGNPPFLGGKKMRSELGNEYTNMLRQCYEGRVPGFGDLVIYWFEKARAQIEAGKCQRAGLVATNSIRQSANRKVLSRILDTTHIFNAWSDEEWVNEGAAVRVSLVCFGTLAQREITSDLAALPPSRMAITNDLAACCLSQMASSFTSRSIRAGGEGAATLDGQPVEAIHADLTAGGGLNLTQARPLRENAGVAFIGTQKNGEFDISGELARQWLKLPNPNGRPNADVVKPRSNGMDITRRPSDTWIVDFGIDTLETDASLYEAPFEHVLRNVKPTRTKQKDAGRQNSWDIKAAQKWWLLWCARPEMRAALAPVKRFIATPMVAKHRLFVWLPKTTLPDQKLIAIAREDDATFGVLHSRFHELWALRSCSWIGVGNDPTYTPSTTFETFPFPQGLTPKDTLASVRPELDGTTGETTSHLTQAASCQVIGYSYLTNPAKNAGQVIGYVEGRTDAQHVHAASTSSARTGVVVAIAATAQKLNELRDNWLNPPEWVDWVRTPEEEKTGYPLRPVAKLGFENELKKRTLTNLYNARPAWLANAHAELDATVAAAYGWADYTATMPDEEILRRLLALNLARVT